MAWSIVLKCNSFHKHTAIPCGNTEEQTTTCKNKITLVKLQHGFKYFWLHKFPKKHLCNKPHNFTSTKLVKNMGFEHLNVKTILEEIQQGNYCLSSQPLAYPLSASCCVVGGVSDRMGMRQDRIRRTCNLNMALAAEATGRQGWGPQTSAVYNYPKQE